MGMAQWPFLFAGGASGGAVASVIAILAGAACGAVATVAVWMRRGPLLPIGDQIRILPEAKRVLERGYEICFRQGPASKRFQPWIFTAHLRGRTVGRLDVDFIQASRRLYVANVHVVEAHGNRGLAGALLLSAAKATDCRVVATSSRTRQGARFFAKAKLVLKGYGVEMCDPPTNPGGEDS